MFLALLLAIGFTCIITGCIWFLWVMLRNAKMEREKRRNEWLEKNLEPITRTVNHHEGRIIILEAWKNKDLLATNIRIERAVNHLRSINPKTELEQSIDKNLLDERGRFRGRNA